MRRLAFLLCVGAVASCAKKAPHQPTRKVSGSIDGAGTFDILIPEGYVTASAHSTGSSQRWTLGRGDPSIELDTIPSEMLPTCARSRSDESIADELGAQKDISICRQSDGVIYVRRMTRGDDPLSCFVAFKANEDVAG